MSRHREPTTTDWVVVSVAAVILGGLLVSGCPFGALAPAQEAARRAACMNNVRQIGLAMIQYAGDYDDFFMPLADAQGNAVRVVYKENDVLKTDLSGLKATARSGFAHLLKEGYLTTTKVFVCPSSSDRLPDDTFPSDYPKAGLSELILAEGNCSYGWDPTKTHAADATCAMVADKPSDDVSADNEGTARNNSDNHGKEGQNIFYNDGHTRWATVPVPDLGDDPDIYLGGAGYEKSSTDAKIIR